MKLMVMRCNLNRLFRDSSIIRLSNRKSWSPDLGMRVAAMAVLGSTSRVRVCRLRRVKGEAGEVNMSSMKRWDSGEE